MLENFNPGLGAVWHCCAIPNPEAQSLRLQFDHLMTRWVPKRRNEFLAGRWCVQQCYGQLGIVADLPAMNADRSPAWPAGVRGSISHSDTLAIAVVTHEADVGLVGVDVESIVAMAESDRALDNSIACKAEVETITRIGFDHQQAMALIFSAKESLYKALYPRVGRYFDYLDARVTAVDAEFVDIQLLTRLGASFPPGRLFRLHYQFNDHHVLTFLAETG